MFRFQWSLARCGCIEFAMRILSALRNSLEIVFTDTLLFPFSKVSGKPLSAMEVSKGRDADSRGGEKGRGDEETDSTIVGAMGRKDGRPGKEETTWFVKRRGKRWAPRVLARGRLRGVKGRVKRGERTPKGRGGRARESIGLLIPWG